MQAETKSGGCPFLAVSQNTGRLLCLARPDDVVMVSSHYADTICHTAEYPACIHFRRVQRAPNRGVREVQPV